MDNSRTKKTEETLSPKECSNCGADLKGEDATKIDQRKKIDIIYEIVETTFTAETKECPDCGEKTKVDFPEGIDGKVQYGNGITHFPQKKNRTFNEFSSSKSLKNKSFLLQQNIKNQSKYNSIKIYSI